MARQRIHNRRAGRGSGGTGASWISYSDMMAALLLIFVLILTYSLYQYFTMLEAKTKELNAQQLVLDQQTIDLQLAKDELDDKEARLVIIQGDLDDLKVKLEDQEKTLSDLQIVLSSKEADLEAATIQLQEQKDLLNAQALRIDKLIGIRSTMIQDLSNSLSAANLKAAVDPNTGDIMLDSAVFFETGSSEIRQEGKDLLDRFIPVYLDVLLRDQYSDYLGEIIIEGHTDSKGSYESNLKLSQNRALQVALYCLKMPSLTGEQKAQLQKILTAKGRSYADLIYVDGIEDADASRRVEFKFSLKDSEMIAEMNRILSGSEPAPAE
ncbi:OmpA family protein [Aristaeella lactis]|uniref:Chemotaxis protein MotB n=1 Tax=Aristaeella lactis TaxID=3046383 RepID=A0AC61PHP3_9FIRM|nr:OmpA family protein [Aristaeella lactis]QUA53526.1 OmpA family protein [Aristaeella lactis]SMC36496.1 chemotaxis protein MotB [Aristaeella lactis]